MRKKTVSCEEGISLLIYLEKLGSILEPISRLIKGCTIASLQEGDKAPEFELLDQNNNKVSLSNYSGKKLLIYFTPRQTHLGAQLSPAACEMQPRT